MDKVRLGVLASGGGSNLQAIIDAIQSGVLPNAELAAVICNKKTAFALERAKKAGIESIFMDPLLYAARGEYYEKIADELESRKIALICLAGFLLKLEPNIIHRFRNRILNIHPALLPKFGGKGMYGHFVHEAVLKAGEKESGCTVHVVDEEFDHGAMVLQRKVPVLREDSPESLAARVLKVEHLLYPEAIRKYIESEFRP